MNTAENIFSAALVEPEITGKKFIEPGWHKDIPNEDYHGSSGVSSTTLKKMLTKTPAHVKHGQSNPMNSTANMNLGTAVHSLVLEPEQFDNDIAVMPDYSGKGSVELKREFKEANQGKTIITGEQLKTAEAMAESVKNHAEAMLLLDGAITESSIYWWYHSIDEDDNTEYKQVHKVRPDALGVSHPVCIDLKSCADATEDGFSKAVMNFGYHISAAMYLDGLNQCSEALEAMGVFAVKHFMFIVVENTAPYVTAVYRLSEKDLELGKKLYRRAAFKYKKAKDQDWPALPGIRELELPAYASKVWRV